MQQPNNPPPEKDPQGGGTPPRFPVPRWIWPIIFLVLLAWTFSRLQGASSFFSGDQQMTIPYSLLVDQVKLGNVEQVTFQDAQVRGVFKLPVTFPAQGSPLLEQYQQQKSTKFITTLPSIGDAELLPILREYDVLVMSQIVQPSPLLELFLTFGPLALIVGFFFWSMRRAQGQMGNVFGFGRTQAREYTVERPQVTFADVAGQDAAKSELVEIVDFLKEPDKYIQLGARIPRGVLLIGPPGTGKTLMARAVAGEASVAFFSIAASEFVEMFVGVGASRVRDLFGKAKAAAPSIVFIDEIDAVGRQRGAGLGGGNDEREQTLNQLLSEMDGFDQTESVIVMAATNRPDVLDPALLRPGRFDRQVTVGLPDKNGRLDMLKIHTRGKPLGSDVNLDDIAKATIGFSGADISNIANEAALTAARRNAKRISQIDFLDAFDRIILGTKSPPLSNENERKVVAYHEAGHAIVNSVTPGANKVFKVTIVPRGQALGVTASLPDDDQRNYSRNFLMGHIYGLLGGRAAEEIVFSEVTTGASSDLRRATDIAHRMVAEFGMSAEFGLLNFGDHERQPFLGYSMAQPRSYSEETSAKIDAEVRRIIESAYQHTLTLVRENRAALDRLADELLNNEVVDGARVLELLGKLPAAASEETASAPAPQ